LFAIVLCGCTGHIGDSRGFGSAGESRAGGGGRSEAGAGAVPGGAAGHRATGNAPVGGTGGTGGRASNAGGGGAATHDNADGGAPSTSDKGNAPPPPVTTSMRLYGVTIDSIDSIDDIVQSLQLLSRKPTTRVVFDAGVTGSHYARGVSRIHGVSGVMGEVLDSYGVKDISVDDYASRFSDYLDSLGDDVDIWEIGNEVNGEWLGDNDDVHDKITSAYQLVHARGKTTALTLYYNQGCFSSPDHEMFRWATQYVDDELKSGLDYVFISYYEDDCKSLQPDWPSVFAHLATMFPNSKLGFGECGTTDTDKKAEYIERYYQMEIALPQYVGGYFWWYFYQDMLPHTSMLWSVLNQAFENGP
jgi:hypothetical protein